MAARPDDDLVEQLVDVSQRFDEQNQALRDRIVELMRFAEHQVAVRVHLALDHQAVLAQRDTLATRVSQLETQLATTEDALRAIEQSRLFRAAAPARRVYAWTRRRVGAS